MRRGLLVLLVGLFVCAPAQAVTLTLPDGQAAEPYQRWADVTRVPTVNERVRLFVAGCPYDASALGCVGGPDDTPDGPMRLWITSPQRWLLYHELGHVFDYRAMTPIARHTYQIITRTPWDEEAFADAYMGCALPRRYIVPTDSFTVRNKYRRRRVCSLIRRQGRRVGATGWRR